MSRLSYFARLTISVLFILSACLQGVPSASAQEGGVRTAHHPYTGKVSFIGAAAGRPIDVPAARAAGLTQRDRALTMVQRYASDLGVAVASRELQPRAERSERGREITRFQQVHQGIPVMAGELVVNARGAGMVSINGEISPDLDLNVQPTVTAELARQAALQAMARKYQGQTTDFSASEPELWIYDSRLLRPDGLPAALVWRMEVGSADGSAPINELVLIDAQRGNVRLNFNQIDTSWSVGAGSRSAPAEAEPIPAEAVDAVRAARGPLVPPMVEPSALAGTGTGDRYVSTTGADSGDCTSSASPCLTINYAIGQANAGETIFVAEGTYINASGAVVNMTKSINISGGWDTGFATRVGASVLDGQGKRQVVRQWSAYTAVLENLSIQNGYASYGGGIEILGPVTLRNSTVSGSRAANYGGGIHVSSAGGITLNNVTITDNTAYGGGGIYAVSTGAKVVQNSIVAGNTATTGPDCHGTINTSDHNVLGNTANCTVTAGTGDQFNVDPLLSPFLIGPHAYYPLRAGSPAIEAGDNATCEAMDQRGAARPQAASCDSGAYEYMDPGAAAQIGVLDGSGQRAAPNATFAIPLSAWVVDDAGTPVSGVQVSFTAPASGASGTFSDSGTNVTAATTDGDGVATAPTFNANDEQGPYVVTAALDGVTGSADYSLTNVAWYVSTAGDDSNSCALPADPCLTINGGIGKATAGDTVRVAEGTYTSSGTSVVSITKSVTLSGGWDGAFTAQTGSSTIDGQNARRGVDNWSGYVVVIEQFTIKGGTGSGTGGGGIRTTGDLTLRNSTVTGNAGSVGGGIFLGSSRPATIENSSIANNSARDGSGGGIYNALATLSMRNSVIAHNTAASGGPDCAGTIQTSEHNVIENTAGCTIVSSSGDHLNVDPLLSPYPVGPYAVHTIITGSPAINAGDNAICPATDQRGMSRPQDGTCDAGSYEYVATAGAAAAYGIASGTDQTGAVLTMLPQPLGVYVVDGSGTPVSGHEVTFTAPASGPSGTFDDTQLITTTLLTDSYGLALADFTANGLVGSYIIDAVVESFEPALQFQLSNGAWFVAPSGSDSNSCTTAAAPCQTLQGVANKAVSGDVILAGEGTYLPAPDEVLDLYESLRFFGGWNSAFTQQTGYSVIDGQGTTQGIDFDNPAGAHSASFDRFIIQNGYAGVGGGVYSTESLTFTNSILRNNRAYSSGGAVYMSGTLTLENTLVLDNGSESQAGGIQALGALTIRNSTISGNRGAGAIASSSNGSLLIQNSTIVGNSGTPGNPGGILEAGAGTVTLQNSILAGNWSKSSTGPDCAGTIDTSDHNIIGNTTGCTVTAGGGDQFNVSPLLADLVDERGYYLPQPGSPAIDAGNPATCLSGDQRGIPRPQGPACELGAIELGVGGSVPSEIMVIRGSPQFAQPTHAMAVPLSVLVTDAAGYGVEGLTVTFTAAGSAASGTFGGGSSTSAVTDVHGFATSGPFTANAVYGSYGVDATIDGLFEGATFRLGNVPPVETYNMGNATEPLPGTFLCDENSAGCTNGADRDADAAHQFALGAAVFYADHFGRESLDDAGMAITSSVHYGTGYDNAIWSGTQMVYGDADTWSRADDVVAHELTHGVTQYESNLFYYFQPGAINESLSDIFGELFDQTNGAGSDDAGMKWVIGEDLAGYGPIRSMSDPPLYGGVPAGIDPLHATAGDPDRVTSANYYIGEEDNGGVHENSGVNNKAAYLLVDGGSFNGETVTPIGADKTLAVYYEAQVNLLTSGSDFGDLYYLMVQACENLVGGAAGVTAEDCLQVQNAVDAVDMDAQPTGAPDYSPNAEMCGAGMVPAYLFSDTLEAGAGNWSLNAPRWQYDSPYDPLAHSGLHYLYADDYPPSVSDVSASMNSSVSLPPGAFLHFAHAYNFEHYTGDPNWYDGGVLEYSTNGGGTWKNTNALPTINGYDGQITTGEGNPLAGRQAFVGLSNGYVTTRVDLSSLSGQNVRFRWRMGLDAIGYGWGWWLDDVRVYTCESVPVTVSGNAGVGGASLSYDHGGPQSVTADIDGDYAFTVPAHWSGTVTPAKEGYLFYPASRSYTDVVADQVNQDYAAEKQAVAQFAPASGATTCRRPQVGVVLNLSAPTRLASGAFNPATVTLKLDNVNVTSQAQIRTSLTAPVSRATILFQPSSDLALGAHQVQFIYAGASGPLTTNWSISAANIACGSAFTSSPVVPNPLSEALQQAPADRTLMSQPSTDPAGAHESAGSSDPAGEGTVVEDVYPPILATAEIRALPDAIATQPAILGLPVSPVRQPYRRAAPWHE